MEVEMFKKNVSVVRFKPIQQGEKNMVKLFKTLSILIALALFTTACGAQLAQAAGPVPAVAGYQAILGRSVSEQPIADFIDSNCSQSGSFHFCRSAGLALWTDVNQIVRQAYLYIHDAEGFATYKGELPFGLASNDTMADVEQKLGSLKEVHAPQAGWEPGLPDEGYSRDLTYYWAIYRRFGLTVIYNTPAANDKDATIYAIVVNQ
jgi:hypothetical protein